MFAERRLEAPDGASLIAAATPADADSSKHLPVNGSGLTRLERRLRLQQRSANVVVNLSVHAPHMDEFAALSRI